MKNAAGALFGMMGQNTSIPHESSVIMPGPIDSIPDDVLDEIFKRVDDKRFLLKVCTLVCKRWNAVLSDWRFWSSYILNNLPQNETKEYKSLFKKHPEYQRQRAAMMAIERPLGRNLTGHVCGEGSIATEIASGKSDWVVSKLDKNWQGGSAWIIENPGSEHSYHPEAVLASSFYPAELSLTLFPASLSLPAGDNCDLSLHCQLEVEAATRPDSGGCLNMSVITQAGAESTTVNSSNIKRINLDPGSEWHFERCASTFPGDVKSITIKIECKDDRFWSGHYGTKLKRVRFTLRHTDDGE